MKTAAWIVATLLTAVVFHVITIMAYPTYVLIKLSMDSDNQPNAIYHAPPVDETSRRVVRPSPDLIYSICPYDVSERPLKITAPVPEDAYWSVSMFAANTDNFFVVNDLKLGSDQADIVLVKEGTKLASKDAMVVEAKTTVGVVLFRVLVTDEERLEELIEVQRKAKCEPM